jgi:hypothetical protein
VDALLEEEEAVKADEAPVAGCLPAGVESPESK